MAGEELGALGSQESVGLHQATCEVGSVVVHMQLGRCPLWSSH
jgi:hypothetical protein